MQKPVFEIVTTTAGAISIRNNIVNETMHNPVGPWKEANELYIQQSKLAERLKKSSLAVFDVGLGAAANALATLHCHASTANANKLHLVSFERDLELLRFAIENAHHFEHFTNYVPALRTLLEKGSWNSPDGQVTWILHHGDFTQLVEQETSRPDIIFYDPYSPKVNGDMWSLDGFKKLYKLCTEKADANACTELYTYTQATPVRYNLLRAGFFVGIGSPTGLKADTTIASTKLESLTEPLNDRWAQRLRNSDSLELKNEKENIEQLLRTHRQFTVRPDHK